MAVHEFQQRALDKAAERKQRKVARKYDFRTAPAAVSGRNYLSALRKRSSEKGMDFDLTADWIAAKLKVTQCEATGIPFHGAGNDPFGRTFDRKDSSKGYTKDNCWVVCWIYNRCKLDGTHADVMRMVLALADR